MNMLGAHEVLDLHEVLSESICALNTMQLYRPYVQDQQLQQMMNRHMQAMIADYNNMVQTAHQLGGTQAMPARAHKYMANPNVSFQPMYGLHNPQTQTPAAGPDQIDDVDAVIALLNSHKTSAAMKMKATLEMAHPTLRHLMQTSANSCADMAYECFQYANSKGYYQVPTLKDTTTNTMIQSYGTAPMASAQNGQMQQQQQHMGNYYM